jgi:hypothetical protein
VFLETVSPYLLTYLLMELSPSWGAANCAAPQELPSILWNQKVQYRVHKSPGNCFPRERNVLRFLRTVYRREDAATVPPPAGVCSIAQDCTFRWLATGGGGDIAKLEATYFVIACIKTNVVTQTNMSLQNIVGTPDREVPGTVNLVNPVTLNPDIE